MSIMLSSLGQPFQEPRSAAPLYRLDAVSFQVDEHVLLHPLTLDLPARRVIGLIGHNGSGKSTLLTLLAAQQKPSTGNILFEGRELSSWPPRAFARRVAYLPQATPVADAMLVHELVALGRYPWHGAFGRFAATDAEKVASAMVLTGVDGLADRFVESLSGGERQRVWLAMLVAQDAGSLLLDEPISALDIARQIDVLTLVRRLADERGLGIVIVLHDVNLAARYCDEILALHSGRLLARGTPAEIMRPDVLEAVYGIEMEVMEHPPGGRPIAVVR